MPIKVHGVPASMNCVGPILYCLDKELGTHEYMMPYTEAAKTPAYHAINPFHQVPSLEDPDNKVNLGESNSILRYMGNLSGELKNKTLGDNATVDWALERFMQQLYPTFVTIVYPLFGYVATPSPEELKAAITKFDADLPSFLDKFLPDETKFVNGASTPGIGDYKLAPYLFCLAHKSTKMVTGYNVPERAHKFLALFKAASKNSAFLQEAGGYGLGETLDKK